MNLELHLTANLGPLLAFLFFAAFMVGVPVLTVLATNAQRGRAVRELEAFAALLEGGEAHTSRADYWSGLTACSAAGRLEGHPVRVSFARRGAGKHAHTAIVYAVQVQHPAASFEVAEVDALEALSRLVGLTSTDALRDQGLVLRKGGAPAGRLLQAADVRAALEAVLRREGVSSVALEGTTLKVEQRAAIRAGPMRDTLRPLLRLAALVARRPVELRVAPRAPAELTPAPTELAARFAWTGGGEAARCPYCRDELDAAAPEAAACDRCGTVHHRECLDEAGGCTVFGCGAHRSEARAIAERGARRPPPEPHDSAASGGGSAHRSEARAIAERGARRPPPEPHDSAASGGGSAHRSEARAIAERGARRPPPEPHDSAASGGGSAHRSEARAIAERGARRPPPEPHDSAASGGGSAHRSEARAIAERGARRPPPEPHDSAASGGGSAHRSEARADDRA